MLSTLRRDLNGATHALPSTLPSNLDKDLRPEQKMFHTRFACLTSLALSSTQSCLISKSRSFDPPPPPTPFIVKTWPLWSLSNQIVTLCGGNLDNIQSFRTFWKRFYSSQPQWSERLSLILTIMGRMGKLMIVGRGANGQTMNHRS